MELSPEVYLLDRLDTRRVGQGECSVVDNVNVRIHRVKVLDDTVSLHIYPNDHDGTHLFVPREDGLYDRVAKGLRTR